MTKLLTLCAAALLAGLYTAPAEEFPLQFKTLDAKDVMRFPGGYGSYGQIRPNKPEGLKAEPKAASKRPLYGKIGENMAGAEVSLFRLDESQGDGKGYDQIIVDLNQNGDLTDDPVAGRVTTGEERNYPTNGPEFAVFGPMESTKTINGHHPVYFAQAYIYARMYRTQPEQPNAYLGQVRFKAGWYLETSVTLGSLKKKVGLYDANSNQQLGELAKCQT
ncbi:MAG TPA: hypothetical protein VNZ22_05260, partial [Bacillota bacterium]|nr:hypothetical protein [Bacillota bacterium]